MKHRWALFVAAAVLTLLCTVPAQARSARIGIVYDGESERGSQLKLNPSFYYFVRDRLSLGLALEYEMLRSPEAGISTVAGDVNTLSMGPSVRYYFGQETFYPFLQLGYYYSYVQFPNDDKWVQSNVLNLGAGVDIMLIKNMGLEISASYDRLGNDVRTHYEHNNSQQPYEYDIRSTQFTFFVGIFAAF